jgi:FkbM family methyltransferase
MLKNVVRHLRRNPLDFKTSKGATIGDLILSKIDASPVIIDVGARNGMSMFPASFTRRATLVAFEPNPIEFAKLASGTTDAAALGAHLPTFKGAEYHPVAIWSEKGKRTFYITAGPGACTLLGEPLDVTKSIYLDAKSHHAPSYYDAHTKVVDRTEVECDTLDNIIKPGRIVDFLKLDVEGGEVDCLKGSSRLLNDHDILFVYSEFQTLPYYEGHGVFGEQHALLNSLGYRLLDMDLGHPTYRRGKRYMPETADRRLFMAGDAIFCVDPDRVSMPPEKLQRLAAIAVSFGFVSFALSLLEDAGLNTADEIAQIEQAASSAWTFQRIKRTWIGAPRKIGRMI